MHGADQLGLSRCGSSNDELQANYSLLVTGYLLTHAKSFGSALSSTLPDFLKKDHYLYAYYVDGQPTHPSKTGLGMGKLFSIPPARTPAQGSGQLCRKAKESKGN